jgi:hypothetical protein
MEAGLVGVGTKIIRLMLSYVVKGTFSRKKFMKLSRQTIVYTKTKIVDTFLIG